MNSKNIAIEQVSGLVNLSSIARQIAETIDFSYSNLIILPHQTQAETLLDNLGFFSDSKRFSLLKDWDLLPYEKVSPTLENSAERIEALRSFLQDQKTLLISVRSFLQKVFPIENILQKEFELKLSDKINIKDFTETLNSYAFQKVSLVESVGQFSVHGKTLDLFAANQESPIRIEFENDLVIDIREFDINSQRTIKNKKFLKFLPLKELPSEVDFDQAGIEQMLPLLEFPSKTIQDSLKKKINGAVCIVNFEECIKEYNRFYQQADKKYQKIKDKKLFASTDQLYHDPEKLNLDYDSALHLNTNSDSSKLKIESTKDIKTICHSEHAPGKHPINQVIEVLLKEQYKICLVCLSELRKERLKNILDKFSNNISEYNQEKFNWFKKEPESEITIAIGRVNEGFRDKNLKKVIIAEEDIFPERSVRDKSKIETRSLKRLIGTLSSLEPDDFIVHEDYGIGIYQGLVSKTVGNFSGEFIRLDYADSKLFLPVHKIGRIQKYSSIDGKPPDLDKLGSLKWSKNKEKAKKSIDLLAGDLLNLYSARSKATAYKCEAVSYLDQEFADYFSYNETADQNKAIEECLNDLCSGKPMDRLVCGDVGFGKTEVAMRAAFKMAMEGRQVAILAPTTLLVDQHYKNFKNRFSHFPLNIGAISRFYSSAKNKESISNLATGKIDIAIGTHKILQKNISFKDLGLIIIDEEQRFGVKQKERLKTLKYNSHVLTLTATPIPRTLYMSLINIRDISVISTPPTNRKKIKTYVSNYHEGSVRDAILKELDRAGQSFFVHNQVKDIALKTEELRDLVPEAKFIFAHGQMEEKQLENIMRKFIDKDYDVLVTTTIIENGIDLANVNTLIINNADRFGLAQLYQLRGRVGRSQRQAYCHLFAPEMKKVTPDAKERLKALEAIDDLGQGFQLAMRDLEIRGAGNVLGKEQSGNIALIGYELYTKLLKQAVSNLQDQEEVSFVEPEISISTLALIPENYLPEPRERLILYQRLASCLNKEELDQLWNETSDRYGKPPQEVLNYFDLMQIRIILKNYGMTELQVNENILKIKPSENSKINREELIKLCKQSPDQYKISSNNIIQISTSDDLNQLSTLRTKVEKHLAKFS